MCKLEMNGLKSFKALTSMVLMVAILIFSSYSVDENFTSNQIGNEDVIIMHVAKDTVEKNEIVSNLNFRNRFGDRRVLDWYVNDTRINLITFDDEEEPEDHGWYM